MPKKWLYACMPISGAIMVIYSLKNMYLALDAVLHPAAAEGGGTGEGR
jgi:TRAP-type C4-dicarboxylate transport system permease small subunit